MDYYIALLEDGKLTVLSEAQLLDSTEVAGLLAIGTKQEMEKSLQNMLEKT